MLLLAVPAARAQDPSLQVDPPLNVPNRPGTFGSIKKPGTAQPLYLQGDELIYDSGGDRIVAKGNVEIFYDNYILTADEVIYDQSAQTLTAVGNVVLKEPNGNIVRADRYTLTDDFRDGFVQSLSIVAKDDTRIAAERATRREGNVTEFTNGRFTPCKSDGAMPPLWCLSAAKIIHDQQAATITYQDAQFELWGVPILYLPYFQHADPSVKRKSGLLVPTLGSSTNLGFWTEVPYYFALDPSYDFTFHPLYSSRQGVLYQGEFRQRLSNGQYTIKMAGIDQDAGALPSDLRDQMVARGLNPDELDGWQGTLETRGLFALSSWWRFGWDATIESSDYFRRFYGFDSVLLTDRVNQVFLKGISDRNYFGLTMYQFGGLLLDDTAQSESIVHPILDYNYVVDQPVLGGELSFNANALSFTRNEFDRTENINRAIAEVKWRRRMTDAIGITYTPFAELRGDVYQLSDYIDPISGAVVADDSFARGNAEGGVTVAYPWVANSPGVSHILEPIAQVVTREQSVTQDRFPNEDAKSLVFDDTNLFEPSKFSGYDRLETGTRANVGVQYTFQLNSGGYGRVLAGQSFHLAGTNPYANTINNFVCNNPNSVNFGNLMDPAAGYDSDCNPIFNPVNGLQQDRSDYVLGLYFAPSDFFRVISQSRFDEDDFGLRREDLAAVANWGPLSTSVVYAYSNSDPVLGGAVTTAQQDIYGLIGLQLTEHWSVGTLTRYDIDLQMLMQQSLQVRYADECFVLSATYTENHYEGTTIESGQSVMLRFELKHLGEYQYKTDALDHVFGDQPER